ncbi:L,D-transpeptidase [Neobacillus piezotolerans]|uniref:L,D-transpeptidase n=1 Tax=Neobacillus piezotolerans TaxID=2259171 RepID=A0A3D8GMM1_9BACI|nr:L,D-transpeptidase family protein [Neobacillus piezotolerans]RDU35745.1 L,D-transpeptidase [Neobacillus piezotolerans]
MVHIVKPGETLAIIAMNYRVSLRSLQKANPGVGAVTAGQRIIIPGLPDPASIPFRIEISVKRRNLVLFKDGKLFKIYPIGVGKMLTATPTGEYIIVNREPNPGGPFGVMWLSLSRAGYGIHGTNRPSSIGKAVSHGCVRMYNKDVLELASLVPNGTRVIIRN